MFSFNDLEKQLHTYLNRDQILAIKSAYQIAKQAHEGQTRASGEPYISHPLQVAQILANLNLDHESIIAAILHDVLEDTQIDKATLAEKFGSSVADLVDGVSKLNQMEFATRAEAQAESFRKMLLAMVRDIRVILVKLADRLHNMRTLEVLKSERRRRIAKETLEIYAPIANRLGMYKLRLELEDLAFKALYPLRYTTLQKALDRAYGNRKEVISAIESALIQHIRSRKIKNFEITGREKHLFSIYRKMKSKHLALNEIMDVYGYRVLVDNVDDCYRVLGIVHNLYKPIVGHFKDYIAIPKTNNYQSLHTTLFGPYGVPIEVQIRTKGMDRIAENGIAAHWAYKTNTGKVDYTYIKAGPWLKNLEDIQREAGNSLEFIENVKIDLFPEEVYVFTPKGDIMELPVNATVVDFAYAVHTDIGNACVAAKINRQLTGLSTILENGQTVEVITAVGARPNPSWLHFVVTGKARSHIRHFLKSQRRAESVSLGERLFETSLTAMNLEKSHISQEVWQHWVEESGLDSSETLFEEIGVGRRLASLETRRMARLLGDTTSVQQQPLPLIIKGTEGLILQFAHCCRPIPGDAILGSVREGHGVVIHRENCPTIHKYRDRIGKWIAVEWETAMVGDFTAELHMDIADQRGMLALLAVGIAELGANIEDVRTENRDGHHMALTMLLSVRDRTHLARVIRRLRTIKGVLKIHRVFPS